MRRIEERINDFLARRRGPFTVNDVYNEVPWEGSKKHLSRFLNVNPRIRVLGKKREAGKKLNVYGIATPELGLHGGE